MNRRRPMAMLAGTMLALMLAGGAAEGRPRIAFLGLRGPQ